MTNEKKLLIGHKIRRLRQQQKLTQAQMANDIDVSTSYLNLIERNQRPVTATVLLKLAQSYDIDIKNFAKDDEAETKLRFKEMFNDSFFADIDLTQQDLRDLAALSPETHEAIEKLFFTFKDQREYISSAEKENISLEDAQDPTYKAMQFFSAQKNYFADLEELAEKIRAEAQLEQTNMFMGLSDYLSYKHKIAVQVLPHNIMANIERRFDYHQRRLLLNEILPHSSKCHQIAAQLALIIYRDALENTIEISGDFDSTTKKLIRLGLANYLAGAIILPYDIFLDAAKKTRYDISILTSRFQVSEEQVLHRLTTLRKPGKSGLPFFFVKVDKAGNISKRITMPGMGMHFPRDNPLCARWEIQSAFDTAPNPAIKLIETPEGGHFLSVAFPVTKKSGAFDAPPRSFAIALGCPLDRAKEWGYSDFVEMEKEKATPIGPACRLCWRETCPWRAAAPLNWSNLSIDEYRKDQSPYKVISTEK
jgi:predicted transcriptional regulator/DNA-binding XRE family transcriptional regulator